MSTVRADDLLAAIKTAGVEKVVHFEPKKSKTAPTPGKTNTVSYFSTKFQMTPTGKPSMHQVYTKNINVYFPPRKNEQEEEQQGEAAANGEQKKENKRVTMKISGNHSGSYGELIKVYNEYRNKKFTENSTSMEKEMIKVWGVARDAKQVSMYDTRYSMLVRDENLKGQPLPDPIDGEKTDYRVKLTFDFGNMFGSTEPVTKVKDFRTGKLIKDANGKERVDFQLAMLEGVVINEKNIFDFITRDSTIEEMYVAIDNTSVSSFGISTRQTIREIVINPKERINQELQRQDNVDVLAKLEALQKAAAEKAASDKLAAEKAAAEKTAAEKTAGDKLVGEPVSS